MLGAGREGQKHRPGYHSAEGDQQLREAPAFCFEIPIYSQFSYKPFADISRRQAKPHPLCKFLPIDTIEFKQLRPHLLTAFGGRITASNLISTPIPLMSKTQHLLALPVVFTVVNEYSPVEEASR
jgi:hypothetical protein